MLTAPYDNKDYGYGDPWEKVICTYCHRVRPYSAFYVTKVNGKWFCNNRDRCARAYVRNGYKPKEIVQKVKRPKKTKKGGKSLYRR